MPNELPNDDDLAPDQSANTQPNAELPNPSSPIPTIPNLASAHIESYDGFDPEKHAVDAEGNPKKKTDGNYALKRGRKAGSVAANALPPKNAAQTIAVGAQVPLSTLISAESAARQSANLLINASVWICGEEIGKPGDKAEAEGLRLSFKDYYDARGVPNIPPEIGLLIAVSSYLGPRLMHEKTMPKMERFVIWVKHKLGV